MAIEDILQALDDQAQADSDAVVAEAEAHAQLIIEDGQHAAEEIHANFKRQVERVARADAAKIVNSARLGSKMEVSSAKGFGVQSVLDAARGRLGEVRSSDYDRLFDALAAEALVGASGAVTIHVAPEDAERAQRAAATAGVTADVAADLETAGGIVVESEGGRIVRRNTLEDRLERVGQMLQADIARVLFS
jgi:vacuolar-type H+-ATPase subunit E/Vma4